MCDVERGGSGTGPPRFLRVAIVLWWVVALVLLGQLALMWSGHEELGRRLAEQGSVAPREAPVRAVRLLWVNTAFALVLAAAYLALPALLFRRRPWARTTLTVFAVLHLVMLLGTGAVLGPQAVLALVGVAAAVLMWAPVSTMWVAGEHD